MQHIGISVVYKDRNCQNNDYNQNIQIMLLRPSIHILLSVNAVNRPTCENQSPSIRPEYLGFFCLDIKLSDTQKTPEIKRYWIPATASLIDIKGINNIP